MSVSGRLALLLAVPLIASCAVRTPPVAPPGVERVTQLQADLARDSSDVDAALELAVGLIQQDRLPEAREVLMAARLRVPGDATVPAVIGLMEQETDRAASDRWYVEFEELQGTGPTAAQVRRHRWAVRPDVLRADIVERLASPGAPASNAVAIFPLAAQSGPDAELASAVAWLAATDLAAARWPVIDPAEVLATLQVAGIGAGDVPTLGDVVRFARALGARTVMVGSMSRVGVDALSVQGTIFIVSDDGVTARSFQLDEDDVGLDGTAARLATLAASASPREPTYQEVSAMTGGAVVPVDAMRVLGRALGLTSVGDHAAAAEAYQQALEAAPDLRGARVLARAAADAAEADAEPLLDAALSAVHVRELERAVAALGTLPGSAQQDELGRIGARDRSSQAEIFGQDRLGAATLYDLTLEFPLGP